MMESPKRLWVLLPLFPNSKQERWRCKMVVTKHPRTFEEQMRRDLEFRRAVESLVREGCVHETLRDLAEAYVRFTPSSIDKVLRDATGSSSAQLKRMPARMRQVAEDVRTILRTTCFSASSQAELSTAS